MAAAISAAIAIAVYASATAGGTDARRAQTLRGSAPGPRMLVANPCSNEIVAYPLGSTGNVPPLSPLTGLAGPSGITVDASGKIYVANTNCLSVTVYAASSTASAAPVATISGPDTGLTRPTGIALDATGNIYVVNGDRLVFTGAGELAVPASITVYTSGSSGDAKPVATISGPDSGLASPAGITLDPEGNVYVANYGNDTITVYAAGSKGDAGPIATIGGSHTGLDGPAGIALDSRGNI